jgi:F-type H+-transporting ATPase subunit c
MKKLAFAALAAPLLTFAESSPEAATVVATASNAVGFFGFGFAVFASALAIGVIGYSAATAIGRNPSAAADIKSATLLPMVFAEGLGIVAVVLLFVLAFLK